MGSYYKEERLGEFLVTMTMRVIMRVKKKS